MNLLDVFSTADVLNSSFYLRLSLTLLHLLWQGCVVGLGVIIIGYLFRPASAASRYLLNVVALLLLFSCLPVTFALIRVDPHAPEVAIAQIDEVTSRSFIEHAPQFDLNAPANSPPLLELPRAVDDSTPVRNETDPTSSFAAPTTANVPLSQIFSSPLRYATMLLTAGYILGVAVMLSRLLRALLGGQRLRRGAANVEDGDLLAIIRRQAVRVGLKSAPAVAWCQRITVPVVVGIVRPLILLPATLTTGLSPGQLHVLLTHELAHIRRHDLLVNLLQRLIEVTLFYHPVVWFLSRRISMEREHACDDCVLAAGYQNVEYADALVRMAELCSHAWPPTVSGQAAMLAASGDNPSLLKYRVLRLLGAQSDPPLRLSRSGFTLLLLLLVAGAAAPTLLLNGSDTSAIQTNSDAPDRRDSVRLGTPRLLHPGGEVYSVALGPGGKLVASCGRGPIKIWDTSTGMLVRTLSGHVEMGSGGAHCVAFSPDGKLLASGGHDWTVRIWDVETGKQLHLLRGIHYGEIGIVHPIQVAFVPDGDQLVTGGLEGIVQVWNVETGQMVTQLDGPDTAATNRFSDVDRITALDVSPDGQTVAVGDFNKKIRILDLNGIKPPIETPAEYSHARDLKFSPDGKLLAWCGTSSQQRHGVVLWNLTNDKKSWILRTEQNRAYGIDFSPDSRHLVSSGFGNTIKLWDVQNRKELWTTKGHTSTPWCVEFSRDGTTIASGSGDGFIRLWDASSGKAIQPKSNRDLNPQLGPVAGISVSQDSRTALVAYKNRLVCLWNMTGSLQRSFPIEAKDLAHRGSTAFSRDGSLVAVGYDTTVDVWDVHTGKRLWSKDEIKQPNDFKPDPSATTVVAFSNDGKRLLSKTANSLDSPHDYTAIRVWNAESGNLLSQVIIPRRVPDVPTFSSDGTRIVLNLEAFRRNRNNGPIIVNEGLSTRAIYDAISGKLLKEFTSGDKSSLSFALSPDGNLFATSARHRRVQIWDASADRLLFTLQGPLDGERFSALIFSPDGSHIAASSWSTWFSEDHVTYVWRIADGQLTHMLPVGTDDLVFSPNGDRLLAGQQDGTVRVWDLQATSSSWVANTNLTDQQLQDRWIQLIFSRDSSRGNDVFVERKNALIEGGDRTVAFLENVLLEQDLHERDQRRAHEWLAPLADPDLEIRTRAARKLERFGDKALVAFRNLKIPDEPMSAKTRQILLDELWAQWMRNRRDIAVYDILRQIATPRARTLLRRLADELDDSVENRTRKLIAQRTLDELEQLKIRQSNSSS